MKSGGAYLVGDRDAFVRTVGPRIETALLDDRGQVVSIGKMIELRDAFMRNNRLKILPITFLLHNYLYFDQTMWVVWVCDLFECLMGSLRVRRSRDRAPLCMP